MTKANSRFKLSKINQRILVAVLLLLAYPVFVLGYTWWHVAKSDLLGGRNGPLDAYRHTLASAIVAYTLDRRAVDLVSWFMETKGKESNLMDEHNNRIGARIGSRAGRFAEIEPAVVEHVLRGAENASSTNQITWRSRDHWRSGRLW